MIKNVIIALILFFSLVGCSSEGSNEETITEENKAKQRLEEYLKFMKDGDLDNAIPYLSTTDNLIDVFEYKYLDMVKEYKVPIKTVVHRDDFMNDKKLNEEFINWVNYIKHFEENEEYDTVTIDDKNNAVTVLQYWLVDEEKGEQAYTFI